MNNWLQNQFVETITINGAVLELQDAKESFRHISSQLVAARTTPIAAKIRPAKFLLEADKLGVGTLTPDTKDYCIKLCSK